MHAVVLTCSLPLWHRESWGVPGPLFARDEHHKFAKHASRPRATHPSLRCMQALQHRQLALGFNSTQHCGHVLHCNADTSHATQVAMTTQGCTGGHRGITTTNKHNLRNGSHTHRVIKRLAAFVLHGQQEHHCFATLALARCLANVRDTRGLRDVPVLGSMLYGLSIRGGFLSWRRCCNAREPESIAVRGRWRNSHTWA
jgi:hypothetical protein